MSEAIVDPMREKSLRTARSGNQELLQTLGNVIYPEELALAPSFRIGCIGQMTPEDISVAVAAIREVLDEMGVEDCGPTSGPGGLDRPASDGCLH